MHKTIFFKSFSVLLMVMMVLSVFEITRPSLTFAAGEESTICLVSYPRSGDPNNNGAWGYGTLTHLNGCTCTPARGTTLFAMGSTSGTIVYCIEPDTDTEVGATLTARDENFFNSIGPNGTISGSEIRLLIGRILQYGYRGNLSTGWNSANDSDANCIAHAYATQLLIWETIVGERDAAFSHVSTGGYSPILDYVSLDHPLRGRILAYYDNMVSSIQNHSRLPSFCTSSQGSATTTELAWDGKGYSATLTDTNGVLGNFSFSASISGVSFSVSGNTLKVTADKAPKTPFTITATKNNCNRQGLVVWTDGIYQGHTGIQDLVGYSQTVGDSVIGFSKLKVTFGSCQIKKTSEDGKVEGICFNIKGNDIDRTVTTGAEGNIKADELTPGIYTITEESIDKYVPQDVRRVTIVGGQVTKADFNNVLKRGDLQVIKSSEDGLVQGMKFHLYGTSLAGIEVDEYAVTNEEGVADFKDILISGTTPYTIEEVDTAIRYVIPKEQQAPVHWKEVTTVNFRNILKKFNVTVTKSDKEEGTAQGDATLAGAIYGIYKGETLVDEYETDAQGQFTSKEYVCDDDWTIREITPSEGYLLDKAIHKIGSEPKHFVVEHNLIANDVTEEVIKGNISIIKHSDDGETQIETPEDSASFEIYLKSAGSFNQAEADERDTITCDNNGFSKTKDLPYGVYTVHQLSGWEGREKMRDFDVFICENAKTYKYLINNADFESYFKVVKVDAETGKNIPYASAAFKIYDPEGKAVTMCFTYPTPTVIDTFYTDTQGSLVTPQKLPYGKGYTLVEVQAPYGYVLDSTPISFDITQEDSQDHDGITVIKVEKPDMPQKGIIGITKTGEIFSDVTKAGNEDGSIICQPVYEEGTLSDAEYEIIAAEDIITPDGTIRHKKGDIVDTLTTDQNGFAKSKALYLGKYSVIETKAPEGMVLDSEPYEVELSYVGQNKATTGAALKINNDRQKVRVSLKKVLEQNDIFGIGYADEIQNIRFGLFAKEDLVSKSGAVIHADALIEIIGLSEKGEAEIQTDLPFGAYYIKELQTDKHYLLSDTCYPFTFEYKGQDISNVEIAVNDGRQITNELIYGQIKGKKTDEKGEALEGALIGIFKSDETTFGEEQALMTTISEKDGSFAFDHVPYGTWIVKEIKEPAGYVLNDTAYEVRISSAGEEVEVAIVNEIIHGHIKIVKIDADYSDVRLTGAVFEVYADVNGNEKIDDKDALIGNLDETSSGVYEMKDLLYGSYLVKETKAPEGFEIDTGEYPVSIEEDEKTYEINSKDCIGFANVAKKGSLKIVKTSSDGKVEGFTFRITGENGYDHSFTTDQNGEIIIDDLRIGEYKVSEVLDDSSLMYTLPEDKEAAVQSGSVTTVEMHNILRDTPKTGDESHIVLWISLAVLSAIGIAVVLIKIKRNNQKEENDHGC